MKHHPEKLIRLVDLPREQDPERIGLLIRSANAAPDDDTPAVQWRIRNTLHNRLQGRRRVLRFALAAAIIFVAGGVAGAVVQPLLRWRMLALIFSRAEPGTLPSGGHGKRRGAPPPSPPANQTSTQGVPLPLEGQAASAHTPSTSATGPAQVAPRRVALLTPPASGPQPRAEPRPALLAQPLVPAPVMTAPGTAAAVPTTALLPAEQALIATALRSLRTSNEPEAALAALDDYRRRFPGGELAPEADRLRAEALLLLGRKATLREELDRTLTAETSASDERVVLRGELRAATGRWQAALADFDAVVRAHPAGSSHGMEINDRRLRERLERALWGRASARSHVGDDAGARADLREYLERFPDGRFAAQAGRLLDPRH